MAEGSGLRVSWALRLGHSQGWHRNVQASAALTPRAPRPTHSRADCLHPASQALRLPDTQASGLTGAQCAA